MMPNNEAFTVVEPFPKPMITHSEPYRKLIEMLQNRYQMEDIEAESVCNLCGGRHAQLRQMSNGLLLCEDCQNSEVTSISTAAELLYTTYGSFKRLFPDACFRYPDLEISQQSMYQFKDITHGNPELSGLVEVVNDRNDSFSLRIAKDIPYGFLEELYAQAFSQQLERNIRHNGGEPRSWLDYLKEYLRNAGREQYLCLLPED